MRATPAPPPSVLVSSSGQPVYLPNLQHNNKSLYYVKSTTACLAGSTAGILGLTNTIGFLFFFLTALSTGTVFALLNCRSKPGKYFLTKKEPVLSGLAENLFSYVLFWTPLAMSSVPLGDIVARLRQMGLSEAMIAEACRDPARLARLRSIPETNATRQQSQEGLGASEESQFIAMMEKIIASYERDKNVPLRKPPRRSTSELVSSWEATRQQVRSLQARESTTLMNYNCVGLPKESSSKQFKDLKQIFFDDMWVSKTHKGSYLVCRSVSYAQKSIGDTLVVEDPKGRVEFLGLYNFGWKGIETGPDLDEMLPLGTLFAIREPTFKTSADGSGCLVRVDSPTDLVFLESNDPLLANIKWSTRSPAKATRARDFDYRAHGNAFFELKKFHLALKAYSDELLVQPDSRNRILLLLNRSQTHLNLGHPNQALKDANSALELLAAESSSDPNLVEKAKLRKSKALEERRFLEEALESYRDAQKNFPECLQAEQGVERVARKLRETRNGDYDWRALGSKSSKIFDVGDYVGPIKVRQTAGGRAIFTSRAVRAGDLLLVERAFATGHHDDKAGGFAFDLHAKRILKPSSIDLVSEVMHKMVDDPATACWVYGLSGGPNFEPTMKTSFDSLASPSGTSAEVFIDTARIEAVCCRNAFGSGIRDATDASGPDLKSDSSLFVKSSLFEHSCIPNATWTTAGNVMIIRARTNIEKNTEVFLSFAPVAEHYFRRKQILDYVCGRECSCSRCLEDRHLGTFNLERRRKLVDLEVEALRDQVREGSVGELVKPIAVKLQRVIVLLEATYPPESQIRPELAHVYHFLTELLHPVNERAKMETYVKKALEAAGIELERKSGTGKIKIISTGYCVAQLQGVEILLMHARRISLSRTSRDFREAKEWVQAAIELDRLTSGRQEKEFREAWSSLIDKYGIQNLVEAFFALR
ncbi:hypothetical protein JCM16303_002988 [Sporobolomyces ruberrimus]